MINRLVSFVYVTAARAPCNAIITIHFSSDTSVLPVDSLKDMGRKEERKEGRKEGRKDGRKEGRQEGWKERKKKVRKEQKKERRK